MCIPPIMLPGDLTRATDTAIPLLERHLGDDWSVPAADMTWPCRRTLDHMNDVLYFYAMAVAVPVVDRDGWIPPRNGDDVASVESLIVSLQQAAAVMERVSAATPEDRRVFHPSGLSNADGFRAMAVSELLTHTDDILRAFDDEWSLRPDQALCTRVLNRVFPWAPDADEVPNRWQALRWACGRIALPGYPRVGADWWWHSAPLEEWDGTPHTRSSPPAWS